MHVILASFLALKLSLQRLCAVVCLSLFIIFSYRRISLSLHPFASSCVFDCRVSIRSCV